MLFDRSMLDALRHAPITEGARVVVHANADRIVNVEVDDDGCLLDVDTPADYDAVASCPRLHSLSFQSFLVPPETKEGILGVR